MASDTVRSPHGPCPPSEAQLKRSFRDFAATLMIDAAALALLTSFASWTMAPSERRQALDGVRPGRARGGQRSIAGRRVSRSPTAAAGRARAAAPIRTAPG